MSVARNRLCLVKYHTQWDMRMTTWYRQVLSLIYAILVTTIALWALDQGSGPWVILGVVGMSLLTLTLIFGIEIDTVSIGDYIEIDFSETTEKRDRRE